MADLCGELDNWNAKGGSAPSLQKPPTSAQALPSKKLQSGIVHFATADNTIGG